MLTRRSLFGFSLTGVVGDSTTGKAGKEPTSYKQDGSVFLQCLDYAVHFAGPYRQDVTEQFMEKLCEKFDGEFDPNYTSAYCSDGKVTAMSKVKGRVHYVREIPFKFC